MRYALLVLVGFIAGVQNALAGGGSFLTFPALLLFGAGARAANITSTVALFPGQVTTGLAGRNYVAGIEGLSFRTLAAISLVGGALGAGLLLATPESFFRLLVPFLILFATGLFAWGSFGGGAGVRLRRIGPRSAAITQGFIAIYGGYFGGGIGMLMLAVLTIAGLSVRVAGATKNVLNAILNCSAVAVFAFSPDVHWGAVASLGAGAVVGGQVGAWALARVNEHVLRAGIVVIGLALSAAMFWKAFG